MKVVYITAGAGGMYCGSCMHDNTLAAALLRRGHDVMLLPVFTPIRTDETDVSESQVFYGGINVYLQQKASFFRWLPGMFDRWLDNPKLLRWAVRTPKGADLQVARITESVLRARQGAQKKELERLLHGLERIQPDVVNLPNAMFLGVAAEIKRVLKVPVFCNLSGEDLFLASLQEPYRSRCFDLIRDAARQVDGFIVGNSYYGSYAIEHFGVPEARLSVVPFGIRIQEFDGLPAPDSPVGRERASSPFTIGYLARICQEKGLHLLAEAFEGLREKGRSCRLRVAGYLSPQNRSYLERIQERLKKRGFDSDFEVLSDIDRDSKIEFLSSLDVLSVPTEYHESKGLYVLEAGAAGVPVVQPSHGCFPEMVESLGSGLLFEPGDAEDLAAKIGRLMEDRSLHRSLSIRGRDTVRAQFTDENMADRTWSLYESCVGGQNGRVAAG